MDGQVLLEEDGDLLQVRVSGYVVLHEVAALQAEVGLVGLEYGGGRLGELGELTGAGADAQGD